MSNPIISVASLSRVATEYNDVLRALPAFQFNEVAKALALNILSVKGKHVQINPRRKAGLLKPYVAGLTPEANTELAKFFESVLEPKLVYGAANDNITNYSEKKVISNKGEAVDLKAKKHPLEFFILQQMIASFNEDVIFNMFHAERSDVGNTPATAFNGFYTVYDLLIAAGEISAAKGNLHNTGAFVSPANATDTAAYDKLVAFVKAGHPLLRRGEVLLMASSDLIAKARDAFRNKVKNFEYSTTEQMIERLRDDAQAPSLKLVSHEALGIGDKLTLIKPGLLDFGVGEESDKDFVQVRTPYADPNEVQFWMQASFDTRVNDIDPKVFLTNEQASTSVDLAGDYRDVAETPETPVVTTYEWKDANGTVLFTTTVTPLAVGATASKNGEFTLADGTVVTVAGLKITTVVTTYEWKDADGTVLFTTTVTPLAVGATASKNGEFTLADGTVVTVADLEITAIVPA